MDEEFKKMFLQLMDSQQKLLTELAMSRKAPAVTSAPGTSTTDARMEALANSMTEFHYDPESNLTFENWYARHEETLKCDAAGLDDAARVRLLLRKLSDTTHAEYMNHILPKKTREYKFDETVENLKKLFGAHTTLFCKRYRCLTLNKRASDDFQSYAGQVNRCCEDFGVAECSVDAFKCLIFVCGLHNKQDAEIRTSLLAKLEGNATMTLDNLTAECHRIINLRKDASIVEASSDKTTVNAITRSRSDSTRHPSADQKPTTTRSRSPHSSNNNNTHPPSSSSRGGSSRNNKKPRTPCWKCGELHYVEFCQYLNHRCRDCNRVGHKDGYCQCVRSNPGKRRHEKSSQQVQTKGIYVKQLAVRRSRKFVTVVINDVELQLQLDCASDITVLTEASWNRIGRPPMNPPSQQARTASGQPLDLIGEIDCDVTLKGVHRSGKVYVTTINDLNLLGLDFIDLLFETFARYGLPETIVSDNGTQFTSALFKEFCDSLGIIHIRTAPYHPQSNGQAERFVDTLKRSLKKIMPGARHDIGHSLQIFLSSYRATPNKSAPDGLSPAEVLMGRKHRTTLDLLKPPSRHRAALQRNQRQDEQFNKRHGARKREFGKGDSVHASTLIHGKLVWHTGTVIERVGNVMYNVWLEDRKRLIRSHTNQLRARGGSKVEAYPEEAESEFELPLHILLQDFQLIENPAPTEDHQQAPHRRARVRPPSILRRSTRIRRMPERYNPYFYA